MLNRGVSSQEPPPGQAPAIGVASAAGVDPTTVAVQPMVLAAEAGQTAARVATSARDSVYRRFLALADLLAAIGAVLIATTVTPGDSVESAGLLATAPLIVIVSKLVGIYDREERLVRKSALDEAPALVQLATLYALISWLTTRMLITWQDARGARLLVIWITLILLLVTFRTVARAVSRRLTDPERWLVLGDEDACDWMEWKLARRSSVHAVVVARIVTAGHEDFPPVTGRDVRALASQFGVDRIVVSTEAGDTQQLLEVLRAAAATRLKMSFLPKMLEEVGGLDFDELEGVPLLSMRPSGLTRSSLLIKRSFDVAGSVCALVLLSPLLAIIAAAIKLGSSGPVLFRQSRTGRDGVAFEMLKFRTMVCDAEAQKDALRHLSDANGLFKLTDDPRVTRVGRLLRRCSLDELPQLLNVLRGEMSLVGPRPLVAEEDRRIEGLHRRRLHLTPGMTGHWQVLGSTRLPLKEMVRIDYLYVNNWSLWLDLKIILRTVPYVLGRRGL